MREPGERFYRRRRSHPETHTDGSPWGAPKRFDWEVEPDPDREVIYIPSKEDRGRKSFPIRIERTSSDN